MYKIIGADGKEYGPVTTEQLRQWIVEGRSNAQTQVQSEGSTEWISLGQLAEFANLLGPISDGQPPVGVPIFQAHGTSTLDIGNCIGRSWNLLKEHFGLVVGTTLLVMFSLVAIGLMLRFGMNLAMGVTLHDITHARGLESLRLQWPGILISNLWFLIMSGPMIGGLYSFYLRLIRGQPTSVGDAFSGFGPQFIQLVLGYFVMALLTIVGCIFCLIPGIYLSTAWKFTLPTIIDKRLGFWEGMELSRKAVKGRWWLVFALILLTGLISAAGVLACCIGVFVTMPIGIGAIAYAYEDILGSRTAQTI